MPALIFYSYVNIGLKIDASPEIDAGWFRYLRITP